MISPKKPFIMPFIILVFVTIACSLFTDTPGSSTEEPFASPTLFPVTPVTPTAVWPPPTVTPLPMPDAISTQINGEEGGVLELQNGTRVEIPAGAFEGEADLNINVIDPPADLPVGWGRVGHTYNVDIQGVTLNRALRLSFPIPEGMMKNDFDFRAFHWDGESWIDIGGVVEGDYIVFHSDSFSPLEIGGMWRKKDGIVKISDTSHVYTGGDMGITVTGYYLFGQLPLNAQPMINLDVELILWLDRTLGQGHSWGRPWLDRQLATETIQISIDYANADSQTPSRKVPFTHQFTVNLEDYINDDTSIAKVYATAEFIDGWIDFLPFNTTRMSVGLHSIQIDTGVPRLVVVPKEGAPGSSFTVYGYNFSPLDAVQLSTTLPSPDGNQIQEIIPTNDVGYFEYIITVTDDTDAGEYDLIAAGSDQNAATIWIAQDTASEIDQLDDNDDGDESGSDNSQSNDGDQGSDSNGDGDDNGGGDTDDPPSPVDDESRCLSFGDLPPLNLVINKQSDEPVIVRLPVLDRCGDYASNQWILYPWISGVEDVYIDNNSNEIIIRFSSATAEIGDFNGKVGVRYPNETNPIWADITFSVVNQTSNYPAYYQSDFITTWSSSGPYTDDRSCERTTHSETAEVINGRYARRTTEANISCSDGTQEQETWETWVDLFTGRSVRTTCENCIRDCPGPRPGVGTETYMTMGIPLNAYIIDYETSTNRTEDDDWVDVWTFKIYCDEATGYQLGYEASGKSYWQGTYYGDSSTATMTLAYTTFPVGRSDQVVVEDPLPQFNAWISGRCSTHLPAQRINIFVQLTDNPAKSFSFVIDPNHDCGVSDQSKDAADITMIISSGDLIKLLDGSISYSTLISNGRISIKYTGLQGREIGRVYRNDFLMFMLSEE